MRVDRFTEPVQSTVLQTGFEPGDEKPQELPIPNNYENVLPHEPAPAADVSGETFGLQYLIELSLDQNPRLAQVAWAVETARGVALQAGLYPNPHVNITGAELGDRTGPGGIWSSYGSQEIVVANKLGLSRAAALKGVDQATLNVIAERYRVFTQVREAFFAAITLQRRAEILNDLVKLAEKTVENANDLLKAKEVAALDVVQLEVDLERYRADLDATLRALPGAYRTLAASVGVESLPIERLIGSLDTPLPDYQLDQVRMYVLGIHPDIRSAQIGIDRARLVLRRAQVQPIPNPTLQMGQTYQGQNKSSDWDVGMSLPIPIWNRNQGNVAAAEAEVNSAINNVTTVENRLVNQLATAFSLYAAARKRAERYRTAILPRAEQTYVLSQQAYQGGEFAYLRVLQAQRAVAEANLELVRSLGEMWQAASQIAGLMLEDQWPLSPEAPSPDGTEP